LSGPDTWVTDRRKWYKFIKGQAHRRQYHPPNGPTVRLWTVESELAG
jgi:hypothetical protein